jgi:MoaD family protein
VPQLVVSVKVFGSLREIVETPALTFSIESDNKTVHHVLELLARKFGRQLEEELFDAKGSLNPAYSVLVNGRSLETLSGIMTLLNDADVVTILPVIEGG